MKLPGATYLRELQEARRFSALPAERRSIVFYADDAASRVHFSPILSHLTGPLGREVAYLTAQPDDPILATENDKIHPFYVGQRVPRTWLLMNLVADVLVMTLPDLESFQVKRSRVHPVHYAYVFHSIVSTHMIYRKEAFDHFDTLLVVGPHHVRELRAAEERYGLKARELVEHGYGRLDSILATRTDRTADDEGKRRVLVAPSWAPQGLLEGWGVELVEALLNAGCHTTVRPHPMTGRKWPEVLRVLERFRGRDGYVLETDVASQESLHRSHVMVSDWSGAALEYAFGLERPVLFVDVPRKVRNPDYTELGCEPLEVSIRTEIGEVISPDHLDFLGEAIERLCADPGAFRRRIRAARERTVYNVGQSGRIGAEAVARLADEASAKRNDKVTSGTVDE